MTAELNRKIKGVQNKTKYTLLSSLATATCYPELMSNSSTRQALLLVLSAVINRKNNKEQVATGACTLLMMTISSGPTLGPRILITSEYWIASIKEQLKL